MFRRDRAAFWITLFPATGLFLLVLFRADPCRTSASAPASPRASSDESAAYLDVADEPVDLDASIRSGLFWLERHQFADGMWSSRSFMITCSGTLCLGKGGGADDVAVTALAVLAILESGFAHAEQERGATTRGLAWLSARQGADGGFGSRDLYGHALATIAFCRAYRVLAEPMAKVHAQRAAAHLLTARAADGGWGADAISLWAGAALAAAAEIECELRPDALPSLASYLERSGGALDFDGGSRKGEKCRARGSYEPNASMTALAAAVRLKAGGTASDWRLREAVRTLARNLPVWDSRKSCVDFHYWYAGSLALSLLEDPRDETRRSWTARTRRLLSRHQRRDGCGRGSWDPVDRWGGEGGRVYATAFNLLTLALARE